MEHQEMTPQESPHITWRSILGGEVLVHLMRKQANLIILIMILVILYIDNRYSSQQELIEIDRLKKAGYQVQEKGNKIRAAKGSLIINGTINQVHKEVFNR